MYRKQAKIAQMLDACSKMEAVVSKSVQRVEEIIGNYASRDELPSVAHSVAEPEDTDTEFPTAELEAIVVTGVEQVPSDAFIPVTDKDIIIGAKVGIGVKA